MTKPILVTGATGRQGGTGRAVAEHLLRAGRNVRAMVRQHDERSEKLKKAGAEIVVGDFANFASLLSALNEVESAYFCHPVGAGIAESAGLFASAGKHCGLKFIVDLSLGAARPDSPSPQGRAQWVSEQIFEWAGIGGVHLRIAAFFMENLIRIDGPTIRSEARIANSFGNTELPFISGADVGALAASLILCPELTNDRIVVAGGAERLTYPQIVERLTRHIGKEIRYEELTPAAWRGELIARSTARGEANERGADHLVAQSLALRAKPIPAVPHRMHEFVGRPPISFDEFASANLDFLRPR